MAVRMARVDLATPSSKLGTQVSASPVNAGSFGGSGSCPINNASCCFAPSRITSRLRRSARVEAARHLAEIFEGHGRVVDAQDDVADMESVGGGALRL